MSNVVKLRSRETVAEVMEQLLRDHPNATAGLVTIFVPTDKGHTDEGMWTSFCCNSQQMALAAVRYGVLAAGEGISE